MNYTITDIAKYTVIIKAGVLQINGVHLTKEDLISLYDIVYENLQKKDIIKSLVDHYDDITGS